MCQTILGRTVLTDSELDPIHMECQRDIEQVPPPSIPEAFNSFHSLYLANWRSQVTALTGLFWKPSRGFVDLHCRQLMSNGAECHYSCAHSSTSTIIVDDTRWVTKNAQHERQHTWKNSDVWSYDGDVVDVMKAVYLISDTLEVS